MSISTENRATVGKVMVVGILLAALTAFVLALFVLASPAESATHAKVSGGFERKQNLNVVQCPTGGSSFLCAGTSAEDALIGRDGTNDWIQGGEGNDTYDGKGGCDLLQDTSLTSSDHYLVSVKDFCNIGISTLEIQDNGGNKDVLDLSGYYRSSDFVFSRGYTNLHLDGPGVNDVDVDNFFPAVSDTADSVEAFKFSDKTLTARQIRAMSI
jgi:hypothetical protein